MRYAIAALLTAFTLPASAAGPNRPELPQERQAHRRANCYQCHGQDGVFEGGMNFILDAGKLVARKKIVPGKPDESPLYQRIVKGTMPPADHQPRPSADEKAVLKLWIEAGAPVVHTGA